MCFTEKHWGQFVLNVAVLAPIPLSFCWLITSNHHYIYKVFSLVQYCVTHPGGVLGMGRMFTGCKNVTETAL